MTTPAARLAHARAELRRAEARMFDAALDASNRLVWPGLAAATRTAEPTLAQLNAIAADRAEHGFERATTRESEA